MREHKGARGLFGVVAALLIPAHGCRDQQGRANPLADDPRIPTRRSRPVANRDVSPRASLGGTTPSREIQRSLIVALVTSSTPRLRRDGPLFTAATLRAGLWRDSRNLRRCSGRTASRNGRWTRLRWSSTSVTRMLEGVKTTREAHERSASFARIRS